MRYSWPSQGFRLAYDRQGSGSPVVLLHGWPGDRTDYDALAPALAPFADVIVPDLRGFGESDKHEADADEVYSPTGQAQGVVSLLEELGIQGAVLGGYDIGSLIAQTVARLRPDLVRALVVSPPLPGAGQRVLELDAVREFWYTSLHNLKLAEDLVDGNPDAVRTYLRHFWGHWSGPKYAVDERRIDHLVERYSDRGSFVASVMWYRTSGNPVTAYARETPPAPDDRLATSTTVLWQEEDPIFPASWSDRLAEFLSDFQLEHLAGVGHFTPLEATDKFAEALKQRLNH